MARKPASLTAAAVRVKVSDKKVALKHLSGCQGWQEEAIAYCRSVPELKQAQTYVGNQMAKLVLGVGWLAPGAKEPVKLDAEEVPANIRALKEPAEAELARLHGEFGGQATILARMARNMDAVGETYLVGWAERPATDDNPGGVSESWQCCSIKEVSKKGGKWKVFESPNDTQGRELTDDDTIIRIWEQDATWVAEATCSIAGVLGEAKILQVLSQQVLAQAMRAASNGFLTLANELSDGPDNPVEPEEGAEAVTDPFIETMDAIFLGPLEDPSDPASVQPGLLRGKGEWLHPNFLRHITFWSKEVDDALEEKIQARCTRIARGVNLPVEVIMGLDATTYANAGQVDEDTFDDFLQPRADLLVEGITIGFERPNLIDAGYDPLLVAQIVVTYDASALLAEPDKEKNAGEAIKAGVIGDAAARRAWGFDDSDAPTPLEKLTQLATLRGQVSAQLTVALLADLAQEAGIELPNAESLAPAIGADIAATLHDTLANRLLAEHMATKKPRALTAASRAKPDYGQQLSNIDRDLRTRLHVAADAAMTRTLERAGNRLRSKAVSERALLKTVPARQVFAVLGPSKAAAFITTDDAIGDGWDDLQTQFYAWGAAAQADALNTASNASGGFTASQRQTYAAKQAHDLDSGWVWFKASMTTAAATQLFDPNPVADLGEFDPTMKIPVGMVRQAIARAGGDTGLTTTGNGGIWLALADGGTRPAGGIGTGELLRDAMREHGVTVEAYEWQWGGSRVPFPPHQDLDGQRFGNFDDPVLANTDGWPGPYSLPGDHSGCVAAGTIVEVPGVLAATLRWFEGEMVELVTASGEQLTITPNHPVLTGRGWVPAGELVEGNNLVRCLDPHGATQLVPHDNERPAKVEELLAAFWIDPNVVACGVPITTKDFHGDGISGQISVVCADRGLASDRHAAGMQPFLHLGLSGTTDLGLRLAGAGSAFSGLNAIWDTALGVMSESGEAHTFLGSTATGDDQQLIRRAAWRDIAGGESFVDRPASHAESLGQNLDGLAGFIQADKLVKINRRSGFKGHVYNFHTAMSWYTASTVVVHNCSCDCAPILLTPDEATEVGIDPDNPLGITDDSKIGA